MTDLEQSLLADIPRLTTDEQSALRFVVDRILVQGRASYAPWQAASDGRNIDKEIADECADAIVYTGMRAVMRAQRKAERLRCFKADEDFARTDAALADFVSSQGGEKVNAAEDIRPPVTCGLAGSSPAPDTVVREDQCTDCAAMLGDRHRVGCPWIEVVR